MTGKISEHEQRFDRIRARVGIVAAPLAAALVWVAPLGLIGSADLSLGSGFGIRPTATTVGGVFERLSGMKIDDWIGLEQRQVMRRPPPVPATLRAVVEALDRILTLFDRPLLKPVEAWLKHHQIDVHLNTKAKAVVETGDGRALEVQIRTAQMRNDGTPRQRISRSSTRHMYWTVAQMVAHHTSNGCDLQPGDLLGSGTLSGPTEASAGSLMEISHGGNNPITLSNGETRTFLEDDDEVVLAARARRPGAATIGFGECVGVVCPAITYP